LHTASIKPFYNSNTAFITFFPAMDLYAYNMEERERLFC